VRITVVQGTPGQVADLVRSGRATLGVTHLPEVVPDEVLAIPFLTSGRVLIMPSNHPLVKESKLTLHKLAAYPLIIQHSERPQGARILRKFQEEGLAVDIAVQALDADVVKTYVAGGLGIGIIPAFAHQPARGSGLRSRDVSHLFDPAESAVLLRRHTQLHKFVYRFLAAVDASLEPRRIEALVLDGA